MSQPHPFGAVLFAKDMQRLARFYEQLLAMTVVHAGDDHVVLESPGCQLVVHAIPDAIARPIQIATPPVRREKTPIKLYFHVASLAAARTAAARLGGALNPPAREWEARGFRACDAHDPEGNILQLREPAGLSQR